MTYEDFMSLTVHRVLTKKERLGQAAFNVLSIHYPLIAQKIAGTELDSSKTLKIKAMCNFAGILPEKSSEPIVSLQGLVKESNEIPTIEAQLKITQLDLTQFEVKSFEF